MAHPIGEEANGEATPKANDALVEAKTDRTVTAQPQEGPDPVVGAGITLLGIFVMGVSGATDAHYLFDLGVAIAIIGAGVFVLFVALSAMKQSRASHAEPES